MLYNKFNLKIYFILFSILFIFINLNSIAYILTTPEYSDNGDTDKYLNKHLNSNICPNYYSKTAITLKQAVNITLACNRNIHKALLSRISENYNLDVAMYKFMPNLSINMAVKYSKYEDSLSTATDRVANITPEFRILTPIGTTISLDWDNHAQNSQNIQTFKNASRITIKQPLLKQSGYEFQTASVKNSQQSNKFQLFRLHDFIENEINKTIFIFRNIVQNQKQLDIQQKTLDITKKLQKQTKALIKAGRLAQYELTQVNSQVASQEVSLKDAQINIKRSYLQLINQLGIAQQSLKININNNSYNVNSREDYNPDDIYKTVLENNVAYKSIVVQQDIAKRDYAAAYNQSRWTLDVVGNYQILGYDEKFTKSVRNHFNPTNQNKSIGVQFDIPFDFNPNRQQAIIENKIRIKQLELDKKQIEQEIYSDIQDKLYQNKLLWDKLQLARESVNIKQENFNMANKKYEAGRLSSFELVRIQDDVESSKVIENSNLIAYLNNVTIIDKLLNKTYARWGIELDIA